MTPLSLCIFHFGSVIEEQTFTFPEAPGLYFLSGPNGSGKSTVWKALTWCLFGKDAKGLKAGDVANWSLPEGARVEFQFDSEYRFTIVRTHAPNTWRLYNGEPSSGDSFDLAKDETNELYSMLQLDFTTWLHTVLLAQDEPMFLDLKPSDKAVLFSEVMRLDKWQGFSDKASKKSSEQDVITRRLESTSANLIGQLIGLEEGTADLPRQIATWEGVRKARLTTITAQYEALLSRDLPEAKNALAKAETEADVCRIELRARRDQVDVAGTHVDAINADLIKAIRIDAANGNEYSRLGDLIDRLDDLTECPTCGKPGVAKSPAMSLAKTQRDAASIELDKSEKEVSDIEARIKTERETFDKAQEQAKKALTRLEAAEHTVKDVRSILEGIERDLDRLEDQADEIEKEVNPHERAHQTATADRDRVRHQHRQVLRELEQSAERFEMLGFWVRGFKDIRLALIAEALDHLAAEVSGCLSQLGLGGWELTFEVDRETKSGTIARGFNVFVRSPANDRQVPWESWSGGEAQRLRLAAQMGLANLIRTSTGASIALEVWDEPSNGLEAQGIDDLLAALARRAQEEQRQIWVTDHHALGSAAFTGTVMVSKDASGTHYVEA